LVGPIKLQKGGGYTYKLLLNNVTGSNIQIPDYDKYLAFIIKLYPVGYQFGLANLHIQLGEEKYYGFRTYNGYYYWIYSGTVKITSDGKITINSAWGTEYGDRPRGDYDVGSKGYSVFGTNII
jgi:hypothetical protein